MDYFEEEVKAKIKEAVQIDDVRLEIPPDSRMGDYAFPCFALAKTMKKNPVEIAKWLKELMHAGG
ncbi:arginine--tRNA ligase, partial [Candidatus Woesearchaeota archaeon]|nr:arginine--tRNA ligase [Candidatus Woesearchaeota archaeon]